MITFTKPRLLKSREALLGLCMLLGSIVVGAALATDSKLGLLAALAVVAAIYGGLTLVRPMLVLYSVIIISPSVSAFREIAVPIGKTDMTISGLLWLMMTGIVALHLLINLKKLRVPGYLWPFIAFAGWAAVRWVITPTGFLGLKDLLWYSMPVLFGLFVPLALGWDAPTALHNIRSVEKTLLYSVLIPILIYTVALGTGLAEMTWQGPRGDLVGSGRGAPLYLLVVLAVALANWQHGPQKVRGRFLSLAVMGMVSFTLARMATFLGFAILALTRVNPRRKSQALGAVVVVAFVGFYSITHVPVLQQRFFFSEDWDYSLGLSGVNTAGRNIMWPFVFYSALEQPALGHGLGKARLITAQLFVGKKDVTEYHPHNEYLQVGHDIGIVGLLLLLLSWGGVFIRHWMTWGQSTNPVIEKWNMVALLTTGVVMASSLTDNTLHYSFVVVPAMITVSVAHWLKSYVEES